MKTSGNATTAARRRRRWRRVRDIGLSGAGLLILAFIWQVIAWSDRATSSFNRPLIPGWHYLFTTGFLSLSSYAPGNSGVSLAPPTYIAALRALAYQGAYTWARTLLGLFVGLVVGASGGLVMGWFPITRRIFLPAVTFIRMVPALALLPLFGLWFGLNDVSAVVYISFTVGVLYFVMTLSAVGNVPMRYSQWARTLVPRGARCIERSYFRRYSLSFAPRCSWLSEAPGLHRWRPSSLV